MVTLHHFTDPIWLADEGGWETEAIVPFSKNSFVRPSKPQGILHIVVYDQRAERLRLSGYVEGTFPPAGTISALLCASKQTWHAHMRRYAIHEIQPEARVGTPCTIAQW